MNEPIFPKITRREGLFLGIVIVALLAITSLPYLYAYLGAPADRHFMGVIYNIPDHFQYFSWMRESQDKILVPNQLTPEYSTPLLFNFLWWTLGRIQVVTGWDYRLLYQITRLLAGAFVIASTYFFCSVVFTNRTKRWTAFLVGVVGSGLGWLLVVEKAVRHLPGANSPFALYTSEPNTFFNILAFPHFAIAAGLIALIFAIVLLGQRSKSMRLAWVVAALSLLLSVQHAYDMFIIYPVIALYGLFIWIRDGKFPLYLFKLGVITVLVSVWSALQAFYITNADAVWKGVFAQFGNAGAWTPAPWLLPILMGIAWLLAIWALDIRTPWKQRDDTHLFIMAWFLSHFVLVYLPLNFQIHLLSGWQVVTAVLATIGLYTRVLPWLQKRFANRSREQLVRYASIGLIIAVLPTSLYFLVWRISDMKPAWANIEERGVDNHYFIRTSEYDALQYLAGEVKADDVVLASLKIGQFVPALTGARTFLGHWAQTLDFYGKENLVQEFYDPATTDARREEILTQYGVTYLFFGEEEKQVGSYDPSNASFLTQVYDKDGVKLFKVTT